jgi:hemolysin type calcium-binding protein/List-Bact-rpt repeat protein
VSIAWIWFEVSSGGFARDRRTAAPAGNGHYPVGYMTRLPLFCAFVLALSVLVGLGASGSAASAERSATATSSSARACAGPCMVFVTRHGAGTVRSDSGRIDCGSTCEGGFGEGDRVTLTATPHPGHTFLGWTGCAEISADGRCLVITWGIDCIEARFTGEGATAPGWGCAPGTPGPPPPPPDPTAAPIDHPPLGTRCTIAGSPQADVITGTLATDVICGGGGSDRINGGGGHDLILGGRGHDRLSGGPGREHLLGGPGDDVLVGGSDDDELFGETGTDVLHARDRVADYVNGGRGRDRARLDLMDVVGGIERRF